MFTLFTRGRCFLSAWRKFWLIDRNAYSGSFTSSSSEVRYSSCKLFCRRLFVDLFLKRSIFSQSLTKSFRRLSLFPLRSDEKWDFESRYPMSQPSGLSSRTPSSSRKLHYHAIDLNFGVRFGENIISSRHTFLTDILDTFEKDVFLPCNDGLIFYPFLMLAHLPEAAVSS